MKKRRAILSLLTPLALAACVTVDETTVIIETDPKGARASNAAGVWCMTPCTLELDIAPGGDVTPIELSGVGFKPTVVNVRKATSGALQPNPIYVEMELIAAPSDRVSREPLAAPEPE